MTEQKIEGIVNPSLDELIDKVDSKYALVLFAAQRARQINAYYSQLHEGLFEYVGPLVDTELNEKPLSIALREIDEGLLEMKPVEEVHAAAADELAEEFPTFELPANEDDPFALPQEPAADSEE
ncbi:MAG TPA: DNA-directed RNA polymerase subunit omega [Enteractinococcus helveticum]|uniref:DNA-directed RNA polymerase subunit omega n=1 Tax=Enteractinococcus helveticum TaxID=1837282 RepID=A0A921FMP8_9MICC|nr:DNA-directed RNA polymerase subunit omega [Enteractinococcus helveticum]HJF14112.1 DNA-directed RNA polymerase subunit omega [Enteractinococcus helveticum]